MDRSALAHWEQLSTAWSVSAPLAPGAEDLRCYETWAASTAATPGDAPFQALLLGVTADIARMAWPPGTELAAVDWADGFIRRVWPRSGTPQGAQAVRGDWRELPLANACRDFVIGDGFYTVLGSGADLHRVTQELRRVLRPGGRLCVRSFCRPSQPQSLDALFAPLHAGRVANLDLFRWLLAQAVQGTNPEGVCVGEVWEAWNRQLPDRRAAQEKNGWPQAALDNIERWRGRTHRYQFPTLAELQALLAPHFDLVEQQIPTYEWGERFPRLLLRARYGTTRPHQETPQYFSITR